MRGKPRRQKILRPPPRNIPAYAGKTSVSIMMRHVPREHPRVCGENTHSQDQRKEKKGTSPRMRGKRAQSRSYAYSIGNIPAYAGKTPAPASATAATKEHPRVCGENLPSDKIQEAFTGTSPRMRGKRSNPACLRTNSGNIPAYAGKTHGLPALSPYLAEHPRVCGENFDSRLERVNREGTSPRMRGKPAPSASSSPPNRNIPAHAGKTASVAKGVLGLRGTSPRTRGKRHRVPRIIYRIRNIPAHAGKTSLPTMRPHTL